MIFVDTNVVSELLRPFPDPAMLGWSNSVPRGEMCVASVAEAEPRAGIARLPDGRRKRALGRNLELFMSATCGDRVFPFDRAAARFYAEFVAARGRAGRHTGLADAFIAATAARTAPRSSPRTTRRISRGAGWRWRTLGTGLARERLSPPPAPRCAARRCRRSRTPPRRRP